MRLRAEVSKRAGGELPYNYQYGLASMIYNQINRIDQNLSEQLHLQKGPKHFTFSWLDFGKAEMGRGIDFSEAWFYFSSPDKEIVKALGRGLLCNPQFHIGKVNLRVESIKCLPTIRLGEEARLRTLSPIYLKTLKMVNGDLRPWDLYPSDEKWREALQQNLSKKYKEYVRESLGSTRQFRVEPVGKVERKRIKIAGSYRRCSLLTFDVEGDERLLNFGYQAGFGEKTAMGFGCTEMVETCLH